MSTPILSSAVFADLQPARRGKVRDIYDLGSTYLIVATDRLSAFDVVLPDPIPEKGKVLTQISAYWFRKLSGVVPNHVLSTEVADFPEPFRSRPDVFSGRSMLVRKAKPLPVEAIVRGYLSGSGWSEYNKLGSICSLPLPAGLVESARLPEPVFTPTTKAEIGEHDENITFDGVVKLVGARVAEKVRELSIEIYKLGAAEAETKGIIIADTKFEFGLDDRGDIVWIDEALTPDSSRFWPMNAYKPGGAQPSYDKQFVRDYLLSINWNKKPPAPALPADIIATTSRKYVEALERVTGQSLRQ